MPWRLFNDLGAYIFTWLIGYSALLGPIAGIMLTDYFVIRRTRLDRDSLYDRQGIYPAVNWIAISALILAVLPNIPGFINAATNTAGTPDAHFPEFFDVIYDYAWFIGVTIASVLYGLGMSLTGARSR
jgi:NCS1 family nucleobase:cation symporter-1